MQLVYAGLGVKVGFEIRQVEVWVPTLDERGVDPAKPAGIALAVCLVSPMGVGVLGNVSPMAMKKDLASYPLELGGWTGRKSLMEAEIIELTNPAYRINPLKDLQQMVRLNELMWTITEFDEIQ